MKRRVVKLGPATLVVSLPSKWVQKHHIDAGDELNVEEENRGLLIILEGKRESLKEIHVKIDKENKHDLKHILTHIYRLGYNKIIVRGGNIEEVKQYTRDLLMGFEITSRKNNEYVIENVAEPRDQKYEVILRRIFFIIKDTQETIARHFQQKKFNWKEIEDLRTQLDRHIFFCRRILYQQSQQNDFLRWELLTFLMHIQHAYYYLYKYAQERGVKGYSQILALLKDAENYFSLLYEGYFKKKEEYIHKIQRLKDKYQFGVCLHAIQKSEDHVLHSYLREIFRLIQLGTSPVLALLLEDRYSPH